MKLYKGDVIEFTFGYNAKVRGKVLTNGGNWRDCQKVEVLTEFFKDLVDSLSCYHYKHITGNEIDETKVKLIRPGWQRRQRRSFWKRLKYLVLNRF